MERKEKFKIVTDLIEEFGLSFEEMLAYWQAQGKLETKPLQNKTEEASQYQTPEKIMPGMFVYTDGLIYPEIIKGRQIKAVVGYVDGSDVLAVCLHEAELPWASEWLEVPETEEMLSGKKATHKILEIAQKEHTKAEAAQWCYNYDRDGVKRGEAFLPSITELEQLCANGAAINTSLKALNAGCFWLRFWSSTQYNKYYTWHLCMYNGNKDNKVKYLKYYVRPVIAIKL